MAIPTPVRRCVLHLGLAKTGTTSIQNFLFENRGTLLDRWDILYPGPESNHFHFQTMFSRQPGNLLQVRRQGITSEADARAFAARYRETFEQELARTRPDTLLLSSEYFSSMEAAELGELSDYLHSIAREVQLLVFVRDPWSFATSSAQQLIRDGLHQGPLVFGYGYYVVLVRRFESVFATKALVRPYIRLGSQRTDAIAEICDVLAVDRTSLVDVDRRDNPSLGYTTAAILSEINRLDPRLSADGTLTTDPIRDIYINAIQANTVDRSAIRLSAEAAQAIHTQAAEDLDWLRDRYFDGTCPFQRAYATCLFQEGDDQISIEHVSREDMLAILADTLRRLADLYLENQNWGQSLHSDDLVDIAAADLKDGRLEHAREMLEEAVRTWPSNGRAREALAALEQQASARAVPSGAPSASSPRAGSPAVRALFAAKARLERWFRR